MLNISVSRNWLQPTLAVMRLHAYLAQAIQPGQETLKLAQFPGVSPEEASSLALTGVNAKDPVSNLIDTLQAKSDDRVAEIKKAASQWGRIELVSATFRVYGERLITPQAFINLVLKVRLSPPASPQEHANGQAEADAESEERRENDFLAGKKDKEDLPGDGGVSYAHAPFWPAVSSTFVVIECEYLSDPAAS